MGRLVSVIVPVYRVEAYLDRCIESIVGQTYENLEIILIDDGSPDNCPRICDMWAGRDRRIRVVHKANGGLADARNCGLDLCGGEYIAFVDSDDYVSASFIADMAEAAEKTGADMAVTGFVQESEGKKLFERAWEETCDGPAALRYFLLQRHVMNNMWDKLYRAELFETVRFPVGMQDEDFAVMYRLIAKCSRVCFRDVCNYHYVIRPDSLMNRTVTRRESLLSHSAEMGSFIGAHYPELFPYARYCDLICCFTLLRRYVFLSPRRKEEERELVRRIRKNQRIVFELGEASLRDRAGVISLYFGVGIFKLLWKCYEALRAHREG